jgi:diaminohydroxyphosphoribosylaminopyrimidine deaminase/5-amino-6-(5-phosphoribosylamino)uracil reductase
MTSSAMDRFRPAPEGGFEADAWRLLRALADRTRGSSRWERAIGFRPGADGEPAESTSTADGWAAWEPGRGWASRSTLPSPARDLLELYLPLCEPTASRSFVIGHLGQSLDGCIATRSGDSACVTGHGNIVHLHRLRALCDAILVGAGTVAADDPRLTTRLVAGASPLRVVLDPSQRLEATHGVFCDGAAPTLVVRAAGKRQAERLGDAEVLEVPSGPGGLDLAALLAALRVRGCHRIMVEGGGVTVSRFLDAGLLDRLHIAVAPVIIGDGRPGLRLPAAASMSDARRAQHRIYRMGEDVLFDIEPARPPEPMPDDEARRLDRIR